MLLGVPVGAAAILFGASLTGCALTHSHTRSGLYASTCQDERTHVRVDYRQCLNRDPALHFVFWRPGDHYPAIGEPSHNPLAAVPTDQIGYTITTPGSGTAPQPDRNDSDSGSYTGGGYSGGSGDEEGGSGGEEGGSGSEGGGSSGGGGGE